MSRLAVFGYASLVSPASASQTLGRPVEPCPLARLRGWRRRWSTVRDNRTAEKTFARVESGAVPPFVLGLNVEPVAAPAGDSRDAAAAPNGVLIEVTEDELERLDLREMRFRRVEVTDAIEHAPREAQAGAYDTVFAYSARPENLAAEAPAGAVVIAAYAETVERAFAALGPAELDLYRRTTGTPPAPAIDAVLVRDRIPPGNPREW